MNKITHALPLALVLAALSGGFAYAEGDAAKGEATFKKCKACHAIIDGDGNVILKGGKTGPNLWGLPGRQAGSYEEFNYSKGLIAAGEAGVMWTEEEFAAFVADPSAYLKDKTGDSGAKSKMTYKLKKAEDAADVWAYIASVSPEPAN